MRVLENDCVSCPPDLPCIGKNCRYQNIEVYYCDDCGEQKILYEFDGEQLCIDCIAKRLDKVEGSY